MGRKKDGTVNNFLARLFISHKKTINSMLVVFFVSVAKMKHGSHRLSQPCLHSFFQQPLLLHGNHAYLLAHQPAA
ncbi:hypothetical protein ACVWYF_003470 [Hymenobacter sp. UYAg731]